ncbi:MAG TPA: branched-chain amino acid ABC transporter permease [Dehalococcoidia bacterium]|nr:branched-chain amino acid ABC transporter permease [Dehalococcoidia bacterium]
MSRPAGTKDVDYAQSMAILRTRFEWVMLIAFLIFLAVVPRIFSPETVDIINVMAIWVVGAHGLNLLTGYAGQISIGHAAFIGVGAYSTAVLILQLGLNHWWALLLAPIMTGLVGMVFGLPSLRLKGFYLAMATLAAQFILTTAFLFAMPGIVGGISGLTVPFPEIGGMSFRVPENLYYLLMPTAVLMTFFAKNIARSRLGRAFVAVRDNDLAAEIMGISLFGYKLRAFFVGCLFAGVAGWMRVCYDGCVRPDIYPLMDSIWYLGVIIIGGMGSTMGAIFGAIFVRLLHEMVLVASPALGSFFPPEIAGQLGSGLGLVVFGVVVALFLIFEPRGITHTWEILKGRIRHWPFVFAPG